MTDRTQFEAMLEALINEDQETAKEIFHNIVVAKSREIYEELLESDFDMEENLQVVPNPSGASSAEDAKRLGAAMPAPAGGTDPISEEGEEEEEEGADDEEGEMDFGGEEEGGEEGEEELEDRVLDLEDALEELKAEFEELMAGEEGEEHMGGDEFGGDMGGDEFGGDEFGGEQEFDEEGDEMPVFEYVNKVSPPKHGDNGANTKSIVAGKNDMGGTTANMVKGGVAKGEGTKGGLADPSTKDLNSGNVNVPGAKSATKLSSVGKGHGAEKKGQGEHADNKRSIVGGK